MPSIWVIFGYLIVIIVAGKLISLLGGTIRIIFFVVFALISLAVAYVIFGGLFTALH